MIQKFMRPRVNRLSGALSFGCESEFSDFMRSGSGYRTCSFRTILPLLIVLITAALGVIIPSSPTWKTSLVSPQCNTGTSPS